MIEFKSFVVIGVGFESHPLRNSSFDSPQHFCLSRLPDDLEIDSMIAVFVRRADDFTSGNFIVASITFDGRDEALGITPAMGIPITRSLTSDTSV